MASPLYGATRQQFNRIFTRLNHFQVGARVANALVKVGLFLPLKPKKERFQTC